MNSKRGVLCRLSLVGVMALAVVTGRVQASSSPLLSPVLPIYVPIDNSRDVTEQLVDFSLPRVNVEEAELGWKNPSLNSDFSLTLFDSDAPGGLDGEQWDLNVSADADVCNGFIVGLAYGFASRDGDAGGTDESSDDHTLTLYVAKRFIDWLNVGAHVAYTYSNHEITGAGAVDLDSHTLTYTGFAGASKQWEDLFGSITGSLVYNDENLTPGELQTWTFILATTLSYDLNEDVAVGLNAWWNYALEEDGSGQGNRNSFIVGPRIDWFLTETVSINVSYHYLWGPDNFDGHTFRAGAGILF